MPDAFQVNPHDVDGLKETLLYALSADPADLATRMSAMRTRLTRQDIRAWARDYLSALDHSGRLANNLPKPAMRSGRGRRR
jgi:trehalose 6-phosphate synthase